MLRSAEAQSFWDRMAKEKTGEDKGLQIRQQDQTADKEDFHAIHHRKRWYRHLL